MSNIVPNQAIVGTPELPIVTGGMTTQEDKEYSLGEDPRVDNSALGTNS